MSLKNEAKNPAKIPKEPAETGPVQPVQHPSQSYVKTRF
jgi:hypothetical protein